MTSDRGSMSLIVQQKSLTVMKLRYSVSRVSSQCWQVATVDIPPFTVPLDHYHKLDFCFASFDTISVVSQYIQTKVGFSELSVGSKMVVTKEFPYYSTVHFTSALELFRATENTKLDIHWFKTTTASKMDPIELIRKSSEARMAERKKKASELILKWATERLEPDEFQASLPCLSLAHNKAPKCNATTNFHPQVHDSYSLCEVVDYFKLDLIGRFYVPQYNPVLLKKHCDPFFHPVAVTLSKPVLEEPGGYSGNRKSYFKAVPRKTLHTDCMLAPVTVTSDVRIPGDYMETIPDEINDISEMKGVLAEKTDSPRCKIWFEVFKRTLMKKRPTYPTISYSHFLLTSQNVQHFVLEFVLAGTKHSTSKLEATANKFAGTVPLNIASIREVKIIERNPTGVDRNITRRNQVTKSQVQKPKLQIISSTDCIATVDNISFETSKAWSGPSGNVSVQAKAVSKVSFPNRLYCVHEDLVFGLTGRLEVRTQVRQLSRVPFSVVTRLRSVVETLPSLVTLGVTAPLPEYKFVQV